MNFTALMTPLGPFTPDRRVAVAVSGGADSLALGLLAAGWGKPLALVVDHGLRPAAAAEARLTIDRLTGRGIPSRLLQLRLAPSSAAAVREARYRALADACRDAGLPQLLLGHHAGDQAETVLLRALHGSGPAGRAGMAPIVSAHGVALLRPLLTVAPKLLRDVLRDARLAWIEDPSNRDPRAERARLRAAIGEVDGAGRRTAALCAAGRHWAARRKAEEQDTASWLAGHARLHPALHAELPDAPMPAAALAALIRTVAGKPYSPAAASVRRLAGAPAPATLGGARLLRRGASLHLAREIAAMAPPIEAVAGAVWDGRFGLACAPHAVPNAGPVVTLGGLGIDAAGWRDIVDLPAAVLATYPCLRAGAQVIAIPHLAIGDPGWRLLPAVNRASTRTNVIWSPRA